MAITEFTFETSPTLSGLRSAVMTAIAAGWQPLNPVSFVDGKYAQQLAKGSPSGGAVGNVTEIEYAQSISLRSLSSDFQSLIAAGFDPFGEIVNLNGQVVATFVKGKPPGPGGGGDATTISFVPDVPSPATRTLQSKMREIVTPADTAGGAFNLILRVVSTAGNGLAFKFGDYNYQHANTQASFIAGGTETQPNYLGKQHHRQTFPGDGTTTAFQVTAPFVIEDTTRSNIRAKKRRSTDGAVTIYSEGSGFTVTAGYGTTTVPVSMTAAPTATEELEVTVIGIGDDAGANPQLATITGYDNAVTSIMSICFGAHCLIGAGNGHNTIGGGSFHRIYGGYNTIVGGTSNDIGVQDAASFGCTAGGQSVRVDGSTSFGFGANLRIRGTASGAIGRNHYVNNFNDCWATGYGAAPTGHNQTVTGYGKSTDNGIAGLRQGIDLGLSIDTTDATITYFTNSAGSSEVTVPPDSTMWVRVDVLALRDDNTQAQGFSGQFLVTRVGSAAPTVDGSASDVVVPSVKAFGSAAWVCNIRGISAGFRLRATGEAAKNIRWVARVSLVQAVY